MGGGLMVVGELALKGLGNRPSSLDTEFSFSQAS